MDKAKKILLCEIALACLVALVILDIVLAVYLLAME
jgi:hypothetical protein